MTFLVCVASSVMTPARPTSEPVPAVVGTATIGAILSGIGARPPVADILEIPDRARLPGHEGDDLAGIEARAAAEGDDAVMAAGAEHGDAGFDIRSTGLGCTSENIATGSPASFSRPRARLGDGQLGEARIGDEQRALDAGGCGRPRPAP